MSLAFAGAVSRAPSDTGPEEEKRPFLAAMAALHDRISAAELEALVLVTAGDFDQAHAGDAPTFCIGLADSFEAAVVPGSTALARAVAEDVLREADLAFKQELGPAPGCTAPLHDLTAAPVIPVLVNCRVAPRPEMGCCYDMGRALRGAIDARPERIGLLAVGGLSHRPDDPRPARVNQRWDTHFLDDFLNHRRRAFTVDYDDDTIDAEAGPVGHEIRSWIVVSGATERAQGKLHLYHPMPGSGLGGAIATMGV